THTYIGSAGAIGISGSPASNDTGIFANHNLFLQSAGGDLRLFSTRIYCSGKVGMGVLSPGYPVEISAAAGTDTRIRIYPGTVTDWVLLDMSNSSGHLYVGCDNSAGGLTGAGYEAMFYSATGVSILAGNAVRVRVTSGGAIRFNSYGAGTLVTDASGNLTARSDERLKFIEGEFTRGLAALRAAGRPVVYRYRPGFFTDDTLTRYVGWTTQRTAPGIPEAVMPGTPYANLWDRAIHATMHNAILEL